jgi:hypothetical protein
MVLYITMNGKSGTCGLSNAFALMYRRANTAFYEAVKVGINKLPVFGAVFLSETRGWYFRINS